jgi:hypothetical protein
MGLFSGIKKAILGSPGGASDEYKDLLRQLLGDFDQSYNDEFSPQAHQGDMSRYTEGLDRNLENATAAGTTRLGGAGFRGTPNLGFLRSASIANADQALTQQERAAKRAAILQKLGIIQPLGAATYKQPTGGLLDAAAQIYGSYAGAKGGGGAGGGAAQTSIAQQYPDVFGNDGFTPGINPNAGLPYYPKTPGYSALLG